MFLASVMLRNCIRQNILTESNPTQSRERRFFRKSVPAMLMSSPAASRKPCQDLSLSGKLEGIEVGTRSGLWSEIARLTSELRPRFVIVENVANLLAGPSQRPGGWFGRVLGDLASLGYDAVWHCIPASSVGAPHRRDRVWVVAYSDEAQCEGGSLSRRIHQEHANARDPRWGPDKPGVVRTLDGVPYQSHRLAALGNAVVPQIPEILGRAILGEINAAR